MQPVLDYESLFPPVDISDYSKISIDVFNPDRQMKKIWIDLELVVKDETDSQERFERVISKRELIIGALRWQSFQFVLESQEQADAVYRGIKELSFCFEDSKSDGSIYVDNIRFLAK